MEQLALVAQSKGAAGVRALLRDGMQDAPQVLEQLAQPVEIAKNLWTEGEENGRGREWGIRLQQWPLKAQREWWSGVASCGRPRVATVLLGRLARAFLDAAKNQSHQDSVCVGLARMVAKMSEMGELPDRWMRPADRKEVDSPSDLEEIKRLSFHQASIALPLSAPDGEGDDGGEDGDGLEVPSRWLSQSNQAEPLKGGPSKKPRLGVETSSDSVSNQTSTAAPNPTIPKEMENRAVIVGKQLIALGRADQKPTREAIGTASQKAIEMLHEIVNDVEATHVVSEINFRTLCKLLQLGATSDEVLLNVASALVEKSLSSQHAAVFVELCVLPKIQRATSVISRLLLQTALLFGSRYGSVLVDALLLPLLSDHDNHPIGAPQAEAVTRILRGDNAVPGNTMDNFVRRILEKANARARGSSSPTQTPTASSQPHLLTNEPSLLIFQNLFASRPVLTSSTIEMYVTACEYALDGPGSDQLPGSLKFATTLFTLVSKYPEQCSTQAEALETITNRLTSLMARTTMRFIQKLKR